MICAHCDKPIRDGEEHVTQYIEQGDGVATIRIHADWCQPDAATQPRHYQSGR